MTDIPLQRTIKIGKSTVGLIGLDVALARILRQTGLTEDQAVDQLLAAVEKDNYIPNGTIDLYKEALRREIRK